jgi:protein phosphatase PTC7
LGDSGFLVARRGAVVARSRPLQHFFDCPLQLGAYPEYVDATDTAAQAELFEVDLQPGDVIVAGSDGLWDNLYEDELLAALPYDAHLSSGGSGGNGSGSSNAAAAAARKAAEAIATAARAHASDPDFKSPYAREALQQGYDLPWHEKLRGASLKDGRIVLAELTGGKQDDITVVVAVAEEAPLFEGGSEQAAAAAAPAV